MNQYLVGGEECLDSLEGLVLGWTPGPPGILLQKLVERRENSGYIWEELAVVVYSAEEDLSWVMSLGLGARRMASTFCVVGWTPLAET